MSGQIADAGFRGDYCPAGTLSSVKRRNAARHAGRVSGVKRRERSHAGRSRAHPGQPSIRLVYELRCPGREEFEADYARHWPEPPSPQGAAQWRIGRETMWKHILSTWWLVDYRGQYATTTKPQRAIGLAKRGVRSYSAAVQRTGQGRHGRTIRLLNLKLEELGYCALLRVPTPPGQKDYLRVEWRLHRARRVKPQSFDFTLTSGTSNPAYAGVARSPSTAEKPLIPPASPADDERPATPAATSTPKHHEREGGDANRGGGGGQDAGRQESRADAEARLLAKYGCAADRFDATDGRARAPGADFRDDVRGGGRGGEELRREARLRSDDAGLSADRERSADGPASRSPGRNVAGDEVDRESTGDP